MLMQIGPLNLHNAALKLTAGAPAQLLKAGKPQIAFAGRSNVGKSSLVNCLLGRKKLARVSGEPGKTITVNYYDIDGKLFFVDLPGYSYASVAKTERDRWGKLMEDFFADPERITLGIMIVDARHKPTADDETMAAWFHSTGCPMVVVANKCDKLKKSEIEPNLARIRATLLLPDDAVLLPFSAEKGTGREALLGEILRAVG